MKTILTMPSPELALLTMTGEGKPFVLNRRTMAELEALLDEVRRRAPRALVLTGEGRFFCARGGYTGDGGHGWPGAV